jgi:hypothetical protein
MVFIKFAFNFLSAPAKPADEEVQKKLIPQDNNAITSSTLYVIDIDSSLFNDSYGIVRNYSIYVRQGKKIFDIHSKKFNLSKCRYGEQWVRPNCIWNI